jgi:hypothetical protein
MAQPTILDYHINASAAIALSKLGTVDDTTAPANWWATDTPQAALDSLKAAIGGTADVTRTYTSNVFVTNNEALVDSIDALEVGLAAVVGAGGSFLDLIIDNAIDATVATGALPVVQAVHTVRGEGGAADTVTSITGGTDAEVLWLVTGAEAITYSDGATLATAGNEDIVTATGDVVTAILVGTVYNVQPVVLATGLPGQSVAAATATTRGTVELATTAEVDTGTDTGRAITPDALNGSAPTIDGGNITGIPLGAFDANAVALADMASMAADGLVGNDSGGAAAPQHLTVAETNTLLNVASATAPGTVEIATTAEVDTGTDDVRAISPLALNGSAPVMAVTNMTGSAAGIDSDATSHAAADGSSHTFIDQDVTSGAAPVLAATNFTGIGPGGIDPNATSHAAADGSSHTFIDQDVTSGSSPTFTGTNFSGTPTFTDVRCIVDPTPNGTGVVATNEQLQVRTLLLTFTNVDIVLADEAGVVAYGSLKVADMLEGAICFLGAVADIALTKSSAGVNDDWDGDFSVGTVAANNDATLTGTEANILPTTATPQAVGGATTSNGQSTSTEAATIVDGTTTAVDVYMNYLVDDADHDVTGTACNLIMNGTLQVTYVNLGDIA